MSLGLFLIPTLGGYWLITHWNYTRFRVVRDSGYQLLFKSAFAGAGLFVAAYVGVALLNHYLPWTETEWAAQVPVEYSDAAVLSVLLGVLFPKAVNRFYPALKAAEAAAEKDGNLIELLIMRSMSEQRAVERRIIELTCEAANHTSGSATATMSRITKTPTSLWFLWPAATGTRIPKNCKSLPTMLG